MPRGVTCPIMVLRTESASLGTLSRQWAYLNAKEVMVARATPLARVWVSNISAGMIQANWQVSDKMACQMEGIRTERTHAGETKVEEPGHDDEAPMGSRAVRGGWEHGHEDGADNVGQRHKQAAGDDDGATTRLVDEEHDQDLADEANDGVDGLVSKGVFARDADLGLLVGVRCERHAQAGRGKGLDSQRW